MTIRPPRPLDWLLLLSLVAMWGSAFMLAEFALAGFDPLAITALRIVMGAAVLVLLLLASGRRLPSGGRNWAYFLLMAVLGNCLPFFLITWGQVSVASGLAGILMGVMPLVVVVLAHFTVPGERLSVARVIGFLLGFAGLVVLLGGDAVADSRGPSTVVAELAILGGAVCYGVNVIVARLQPEQDALTASAGVMIVASILMAALTLGAGVELWPEQAGAPAILALALLGLVSTGLATFVYFLVISRAGPSFLSLINYLIPLWAVLAGALVLGEQLPWRGYVAMGLILTGVLATQKRRNDGDGRDSDAETRLRE